jgi:uncharacterized protein involved in response to NO
MSEQNSRRSYDGPAIFSLGFRPFFLVGAIWAVVAVMFWMPQYFGRLQIAGLFQPLDWHAHEAIFGFGGAIVVGFFLTASPNWTGRLPVQGLPLAALCLLWLAGRAAILLFAPAGWLAAAIVDCAFLGVVTMAAAREVIAGNNKRNLKIVFFIGLLFLANVSFHIEAHAGSAEISRRFGLAVIVALVMLIGGRVIPSFTHNYLARRGAGRLPKNFSRFDALCLIVSLFALAGWVVAPDFRIVGLLLIAASLFNLARLARWAGERAAGEPLVVILHLAYLFVPLGFALCGLAAFDADIPLSAGLHAWGAGAIGVMTLAVMTRASLGHTGRALHAGPATQAIYAAALGAALARIAAALFPQWAFLLLHLAAFCWLAAFAGFALAYGRALLLPRLK